MNLWNRFLVWRAIRRHEKHIRWLRNARVMLPPPQRQCARNTTEAVP